jgi:hypothetical protein
MMGICYWCYWGWPKPIKEIYDRAVADLDGWDDPMEFGPGHIVWSDENWDSAQWCLDHFDEYRGDYSDVDLAIVRRSLEELLAVPGEFKEPPADYDDENPAAFPPPAHWQVAK